MPQKKSVIESMEIIDLSACLGEAEIVVHKDNQHEIKNYLQTDRSNLRVNLFQGQACSNIKYFFLFHTRLIIREFSKFMKFRQHQLTALAGNMHQVFNDRKFATDIRLVSYAKQMADFSVGIYFMCHRHIDDDPRVQEVKSLIQKMKEEKSKLGVNEIPEDKLLAFSRNFAFSKAGDCYNYLNFFSAMVFGRIDPQEIYEVLPGLQCMYVNRLSRWKSLEKKVLELEEKKSANQFIESERTCLDDLSKRLSNFKSLSGLSDRDKARFFRLRRARANGQLSEKDIDELNVLMFKKNIVEEKKFLICMRPFMDYKI